MINNEKSKRGHWVRGLVHGEEKENRRTQVNDRRLSLYSISLS